MDRTCLFSIVAATLRSCLLFVLAAGMVLGLAPSPAEAASYVVDRLDDPDPPPNTCGAADDDCSLRGAIIKANSHVGADTITLPAGTYTLAIAGADEENAATGDLDITEDLTLVGKSQLTTIVDANGIDRVFDIFAPAHVSFSAIQIQGGNVIGQGGGGIRNQGHLTLQDVMLIANHTSTAGGALWSTTGAWATLQNVSIANNSAFAGGGIFSDDGTVIINGASLSFDTASLGGGIYAGGTMTATDVVITAETATNQGGGIYNVGRLTLTNATITSNQANTLDGGGLYLHGESTLTNVTVSGNAAPAGRGGGIFKPGLMSATLTNVTLADNSASAGNGGGLFRNEGTLTLKNTLVTDSPTGGNCSGTLTSQGHNLSSDDSCALSLSQPGDLNTTDPLLGALQDNGGYTQTHALAGNSPALDAGDDTGCPATDQRGLARPKGTHCDIGAFEYFVPTLSLDDVSTAEGNAGTHSANFTVSLSAAHVQSVTVNYATKDSSAREVLDYVAASGTLTFLPGQTSKPIAVSILGDSVYEGDEDFVVNLSNPSNGALLDSQGRGVILDDDPRLLLPLLFR